MTSCSPHGKVMTVTLPDEGVRRYWCCGHRAGNPTPTRKMGIKFILKEPKRRRLARRRGRQFTRRIQALGDNR
jgi:hypothetical protein